ncbi:hypothetical protein F5Y16DRAFT_396256 [Xylariaceae sp. FL0255]|nr:hypothetical protein F5Y16DRAFT_396256 [Xylariaceae sp. FL0255]
MVANQQNGGEHKETVVSALEKHGTQAFKPDLEPSSRAEGQQELSALISRTGTLALMSSLNSLIKPGRVPDWLRVHLLDILLLLPQRPDGVRATLEFVFSVHPSSVVQASEAAAPQKQGANITVDALKMASTLLSVPPASVKPEAWFPGIAPQLWALLDGNDGADLLKVAAYVIGFGILGRKQFGAPGTPGWRTLAEPMLACINPSLSSATDRINNPLIFSAGPDDVVDLRKQQVLVHADELQTALKRLTSLLISHPNPGLTKRMLGPLLLPLWALSSWQSTDGQTKQRYCQPAQALLDIYLKLAGSDEKYLKIIDQLHFSGSICKDLHYWAYSQVNISSIDVKKLEDSPAPSPDLEALESKAAMLVELLRRVGSDSDISSLFLKLFEKTRQLGPDDGTIQMVAQDEVRTDPLLEFTRARVLQGLMEELPDRLVSSSERLAELAGTILSRFDPNSASDDSFAVALSLLNVVITAPNFQRKDIAEPTLVSIEASLVKISHAAQGDISQTARNLSLLLKYRDDIEDPADRSLAPTERQVEDRKTYNLALSYITDADSPAPVRSEGLNLLGTLIKTNSAILDIPATLVLLSSLLSDDEEYINLRVLKVFVQLADRHPRSTTREVLDMYIDSSERSNTDTRLRFGEALLQLMQRLGETFTGELAISVGQALLALAGRRGHRPKTEEQQIRAERLAARKAERKQKAKTSGRSLPQDDGDDSEPDLSMDDRTQEERDRNALLERIVSGWESKRGTEDMRIRASALSLFASGMEANARAFSPRLIDAALSLALDTLALEREALEAIILRRAAVMLILTFARVLGELRERSSSTSSGRYHSGQSFTGGAFGSDFVTREEDVIRRLTYVEQMDEDGLVRQHARDALENLEGLRLVQLMPHQGDQRNAPVPEIARIAGLHATRPNLPTLNDERKDRPRIEEIE